MCHLENKRPSEMSFQLMTLVLYSGVVINQKFFGSDESALNL